MNSQRFLLTNHLARLLILPLVLLLSGCGEQSPVGIGNQTSAECDVGVAIIALNDGFLENVCGCNEADGTQAFPGEAFTCTVPVGTRLFFEFRGQFIPHMVRSVGSPSFPSSPPINLKQGNSLNSSYVHSVSFDTAGNYEFRDEFNHAISGTIIVQ